MITAVVRREAMLSVKGDFGAVVVSIEDGPSDEAGTIHLTAAQARTIAAALEKEAAVLELNDGVPADGTRE